MTGCAILQAMRVERLPTQGFGRPARGRVLREASFAPATAVELVEEERMPAFGEVDADLVRPASVKQDADEGGAAQLLFDLPLGDGGPAGRDLAREPQAIGRVPAVEGLEPPAQRRRPVDERQVDLARPPALELRLEPPERALGLGNHDAAARALVEAVDDARAHLAADAGQVLAVEQERVDQRPRRVSGAWVHDQSRGLVQRDELGVLVEHRERDGLGLRRCGPRRFHEKRHRLAALEELAGLGGPPVERHRAQADEHFQPRARELGLDRREKGVEPRASGLGGHGVVVLGHGVGKQAIRSHQIFERMWPFLPTTMSTMARSKKLVFA